MQVNKKLVTTTTLTHEGAPARRTEGLLALRRTVLTCLLWEDGFYEDGKKIADRIKELVAECNPRDVAALAVEARTVHNLRHVPLLLVRELAKRPSAAPPRLIEATLYDVIQRADEITEFVALYMNGSSRRPNAFSKQVKSGLALAFTKFNEYQFAKYDRDKNWTLRDVMFLCRPRPLDDEQAELFKRIANRKLKTPDTWETALAAGADKKETFERLIREGKLGYLALLRNLNGMTKARVDRSVIIKAIEDKKGAHRVLPFRYIAAAKHAPEYEQYLDAAMVSALDGVEKLPGTTCLLIDHSGSMAVPLSARSDLTRLEAACGLAILAAGVCEDVRIFRFTDTIETVPVRKGMALRDAIVEGLRGGTKLGAAVHHINAYVECDRLIVMTDEESHDPVPAPRKGMKAYMLNVATTRNTVGHGAWTRVSGFSEAVVSFIAAFEKG